MVSTSTRRFPSTAIDATVWAAAGTDTSAPAIGTATMIRAPSRAPRTRIPNIMRNAPSSLHAGPYPYEPAESQSCTACSQFREGGKPDVAVRFHFHSKTLPMGNVTKKPLLRSPEQPLQPRHLMEVVIEGKHHQHQHQNQPDPEPVFLGLFRQRTPPQHLGRVEQKVAAIEQGHREQIQQPDRYGQHRRQMKQGNQPQRGDLTRNLRD